VTRDQTEPAFIVPKNQLMTRKILIVGGGFTGLTAALRLAQGGGVSLTLVEGSGQLGGLAGGFPLAGTWLEKTYHHLFLSDTAILKLVEELGLRKELMWCDSSVGIFRNGKVHPFKTPLDLLRFAPCSFTGRLRTGATAFYLKHRQDWRGLLPQCAHDWMTRACGPSAMETIWTPLLKGKFGDKYPEISMAWLWSRLHMRTNSRTADGEMLGYFRGGFNVVVAALEAELRRLGVTIQTNAAVEKIWPDRRTAVLKGEDVPFDRCIFTGSSSALAALLPADGSLDAYARKLRSIGYLGAVCLVFTSDQNLGDIYWVNVNEPGAPFLVFLNHTRLVPPDFYGGKHVYYIGAYLPVEDARYRMSDDELSRFWLEYLPKLYPEFDAACLGEKYIFRFRAAQHIVDTHYDEKIPDYQTPLPGVYLANFSQIFPEDRGTNFAVREGEKIAALVRRDLGLPN
jgi:protoporphyrinogen oxidase